MTTETKATEEAPEKAAWPAPVEPWRAFLLVLLPTDGGGWQRRRLSDLSKQEFAWLLETAAVEAERRKSRPRQTARNRGAQV